MILIDTSERKQPGRSPRRSPGSSYWLIVRDGAGPVQTLTLGRGGERYSERYSERALPVFSFEEEARMFLRLGISGGGWRLRETGAGELISLLHGLCASVNEVALDPLPEMAGEEAVGLVSLDRDRFIECIAARNRRLGLCGPDSAA